MASERGVQSQPLVEETSHSSLPDRLGHVGGGEAKVVEVEVLRKAEGAPVWRLQGQSAFSLLMLILPRSVVTGTFFAQGLRITPEHFTCSGVGWESTGGKSINSTSTGCAPRCGRCTGCGGGAREAWWGWLGRTPGPLWVGNS